MISACQSERKQPPSYTGYNRIATREKKMSAYVFDGKTTYQEYLATKSFARPTTTALAASSYRIAVEVSRKTLDVIASSEGMVRDGIHLDEETASRDFVRLFYHFEDSPFGSDELDAKFHWAFCQIMTRIGRMNDGLSDLQKKSKTAAEFAAYEQYEIARYAFQREFYAEAMESLNRALSGDQTSPGFKLEWRFHQMKGILQLGFVGAETTLMDIPSAEKSFLLATRYAKAEFPHEAAYASLCAGWAAYCQGRPNDALEMALAAAKLNPDLGEAYLLAAKMHAAMDDIDDAFPLLNKAVSLNGFFVFKAAADGNFMKYDDRLRLYFEGLRHDKYQFALSEVRNAISKIEHMSEHLTDIRRNKAMSMLRRFLSEGRQWPLMDLLNIRVLVNAVYETLRDLEEAAVLGKNVAAMPPAALAKERRPALKMPAGALPRPLPAPPKRDIKNRSNIKDIVNGIQLCPVRPGAFSRGQGDLKHRVVVTHGFLIGRYPVTQSQWEGIMGYNPSRFSGADHPVEMVSWEECLQFIDKINLESENRVFRLPTEAEWEYACRAGSRTVFVFGNDERLLDEYAWYYKNAGNKTHPVGRKKPNAWDIHDMLGNVWEWCHDWYGEYPAEDVTDPTGPSSGTSRVIRGGSWNNLAKYCRGENRNYVAPNEKLDRLGFRLVRKA